MNTKRLKYPCPCIVRLYNIIIHMPSFGSSLLFLEKFINNSLIDDIMWNRVCSNKRSYPYPRLDVSNIMKIHRKLLQEN